MAETEKKSEIEVTPEMIEAGVSALRLQCPFDVAFPVGGEEEAVLAVLSSALSLRRGNSLEGELLHKA